MKEVKTYEDEIITPEGPKTAVVFMKTDIDTEEGESTFHSHTSIHHPMVGEIPVGFDIKADTLKDAFLKFSAHEQVAKSKATTQVDHKMQQMAMDQEREKASSLVATDGSVLGTRNPPAAGKGGVIAFPGGGN